MVFSSSDLTMTFKIIQFQVCSDTDASKPTGELDDCQTYSPPQVRLPYTATILLLDTEYS